MGAMANLKAAEVTQLVATYLRTEAFSRRVTQGMIADGTGLSRSAVNEYLNGKKEMRLSSFLDICWVIGVNPLDVLTAVTSGKPGDAAPDTVIVEGRVAH